MNDEQIDRGLVAARFWLRTLDDCDCPEEVYPTGDRRTDHEPYCSTTLKEVAATAVELAEERRRTRNALRRLVAAVDPYGLDMEYTPFQAHTEFAAAVFAAKELLEPGQVPGL